MSSLDRNRGGGMRGWRMRTSGGGSRNVEGDAGCKGNGFMVGMGSRAGAEQEHIRFSEMKKSGIGTN